MKCFHTGIGVFALAVLLAGCGGGTTPETLPPEQKSPDYGQKSADQMKAEYGTPTAGGNMEKTTPK